MVFSGLSLLHIVFYIVGLFLLFIVIEAGVRRGIDASCTKEKIDEIHKLLKEKL